MKDFFRCYGLLLCVGLYALMLLGLHHLGFFPRPKINDLFHLTSQAAVLEGHIVGFPSTRWDQTRIVVEGQALDKKGKTCVTLRFPARHLMPGDRVRVRGWFYAPKKPNVPGGFDEKAYWAAHGVFVLMRVWDWDALTWLGRPWWSLGRAAFRFHHAFRRFWEARMAPDPAALLLGITIGSRDGLSKSLKDACIRAGVYHMVVVSGQNVGMVVLFVAFLSTAMRVPRRWLLATCAGPLVFYALAVGSDPPVLRATVMAIGGLLAVGLGRDTVSWYPLVWAAGLLLMIDPAMLFGASFQLSFVATASILLALPWSEKLAVERPWAWRWLVRAGFLTLAVQIGLWPILAHYFGQLSLAGPAANLVLFPLCTAILLVGLLIGTLGLFMPAAIPVFLVKGMETFLALTVELIHFFARWDLASVPIPHLSLGVAGAYYLALCGILWAIHFYAQTHPKNLSARL